MWPRLCDRFNLVQFSPPDSGTRVTWQVGGRKVISLAAGIYHTCIVDQVGSVWCFGENNSGQLGVGDDRLPRRTPTRVELPDGHDATSVVAGMRHTCVITKFGIQEQTTGAIDAGHTGGLFCFGDNAYGQIGDRSTVTRPTPVPVVPKNVGLVAAGGYHTCIVSISATAVGCFGKGDTGQLGVAPATLTGAEKLRRQNVVFPSGHKFIAKNLLRWRAGRTYTAGNPPRPGLPRGTGKKSGAKVWSGWRDCLRRWRGRSRRRARTRLYSAHLRPPPLAVTASSIQPRPAGGCASRASSRSSARREHRWASARR